MIYCSREKALVAVEEVDGAPVVAADVAHLFN
jgi:hypothetical protein